MPVYTKQGDNGETSLLENIKESKSDLIFEVLGTFDELNSLLGLLLSQTDFTKAATRQLVEIQNDLFKIGSLIANPKTKINEFVFLSIRTVELEDLIDDLEGKLPRLSNFILPGGNEAASQAHLARSVCRRLERRIVLYFKHRDFIGGEACIKYVNRLSDFLFCLARYLNYSKGVEDIIWHC